LSHKADFQKDNSKGDNKNKGAYSATCMIKNKRKGGQQDTVNWLLYFNIN